MSHARAGLSLRPFGAFSFFRARSGGVRVVGERFRRSAQGSEGRRVVEGLDQAADLRLGVRAALGGHCRSGRGPGFARAQIVGFEPAFEIAERELRRSGIGPR